MQVQMFTTASVPVERVETQINDWFEFMRRESTDSNTDFKVCFVTQSECVAMRDPDTMEPDVYSRTISIFYQTDDE